jgi:hypothetical protein
LDISFAKVFRRALRTAVTIVAFNEALCHAFSPAGGASQRCAVVNSSGSRDSLRKGTLFGPAPGISAKTHNKIGHDMPTAYELTRTRSVSAGFLSALAGIALHWLAFGGLESTKAETPSGDLNDTEYIVLGALSHSLATADKRATLICDAVAIAFDVRRSLPFPTA